MRQHVATAQQHTASPRLALPTVRVLHSSHSLPVAPAHPWGSLGNGFCDTSSLRWRREGHGHSSREELCSPRACPAPVRSHLLPPQQGPPELGSWLSVFHTSPCWSWGSDISIYIHDVKIDNKRATMRFRLSSGMSKAGRGGCWQSVPSALPQDSPKGFCFNELMDRLAENSSGRQEKVTLPCSWASSNQKCFGKDSKPWQKEKISYHFNETS